MAVTILNYSSAAANSTAENAPRDIYTVPTGKRAKIVFNGSVKPYNQTNGGTSLMFWSTSNLNPPASFVWSGNGAATSSSSHYAFLRIKGNVIFGIENANSQNAAMLNVVHDGDCLVVPHGTATVTLDSLSTMPKIPNAFYLNAGEKVQIQTSSVSQTYCAVLYDFTVFEETI